MNKPSSTEEETGTLVETLSLRLSAETLFTTAPCCEHKCQPEPSHTVNTFTRSGWRVFLK